MRKLLAIAVVLTMVLATLVGCASATPAPTTAPTVAPTSAPTVAPTAAPTPTPEPKKLPSLTIVYNTSSGHQAIAEAIQQMWKDALGLDVTLQNVDFPTLQDMRTKGNYEIARDGWLGDYADPMTFLDMWTTTAGNNDAHWSNTQYDSLIADAKSSSDQTKRMSDMHQAEKILMDEMPIIPIYHYTGIYVDNGKVTNDYYDPLLGNMIFSWAVKADGSPIVYRLGASPKSIDPQINNETGGAAILEQCFEGLTAKDVHGAIQPGIATNWDVSADGLTWTFHLRDAQWSDGQPVKASDFVYAWQRAVDPQTASEYAYQLFYIKNASDINAKKADVSTLGVQATDDKTLVVTLAGPCGYFTQITAFPTLYPVRKDIIDKFGSDKWALDPKSYVTDGAYKLQKFTINDELVIVKNDKYWNAASTPAPEVIMKLTDDDTAALAAYESGAIDIDPGIPPSEVDRMKAAGVLHIQSLIGTYYYCINVGAGADQDILKNADFRKALSLAIDRAGVIAVAKNSALPATSWVSPGNVDADGKDFQANAGNLIGTSGDYATDVKAARALLAALGYAVPAN